jgi:hypothetical protein
MNHGLGGAVIIGANIDNQLTERWMLMVVETFNGLSSDQMAAKR